MIHTITAALASSARREDDMLRRDSVAAGFDLCLHLIRERPVVISEHTWEQPRLRWCFKLLA
jgi:hypothetical protein